MDNQIKILSIDFPRWLPPGHILLLNKLISINKYILEFSFYLSFPGAQFNLEIILSKHLNTTQLLPKSISNYFLIIYPLEQSNLLYSPYFKNIALLAKIIKIPSESK